MLPVFNVRIYGILISDKKVLVSDEIQYGKMITKFPGGGLQFGEGTIECLKREFIEELNLPIDVANHFYTVDFFQPSLFHNDQQVISIYYLVNSNQASSIKVATRQFDFDVNIDKAQKFRWLSLPELNSESFTLPIDQRVGEMLRNLQI